MSFAFWHWLVLGSALLLIEVFTPGFVFIWLAVAAGATGLGVLQAAADKGKLSIGVDSNQNYLHPGSVLTSMMKRVDVAVHAAFADAKGGTWKAGVESLGLKENGVDYAVDENNRPVLTPEIQAKIDEAKTEIIAGSLTVKPYEQ